MKGISLFLLLTAVSMFSYGQGKPATEKERKDITHLIDQYSTARESKDTILLKQILTTDIDQLVSTGEWRKGIGAAVEGMLQSSTSNPGSRTLTVDNIRLITPSCALVDCRYEIAGTTGNARKMWSSFVVVRDGNAWKISAIRNMLPASSK